MIPYPKFVPGTARDGFGDAALLVLSTPTTVPPVPLATAANSRLLRIGTRAVINTNCLDSRAQFTQPPAVTNHDGEATPARTSRRAANWTPAIVHR